MPPTVLFDLDDTLLSTNMDRFLPGYFEALSTALSHLGPAEKITQYIHFAVNQMVANQDPSKTLKEVFDSHFYAPLGTTEAACRETIQSFYQNDYPNLKPITQIKPQAKPLVNWCRSRGMRMAIATNPLFPQSATRQRIEWAGFNPDEFEFFTSYDDFHFTKPHLVYYAEVLGRLGWPEEQVAMVGDNLPYDLLPMDTMGFRTFYINANHHGVRWESGTLSEVKPWLTRVMADEMSHLADEPEVHIAILRATPAVIDTWMRQVRADQITKNLSPQDDHFSQILAHLAIVESEKFQPRWESIFNNATMTLPSLEELEPTVQDYKHHINPQQEFNRFLKSRLASLAIIDELYQNQFFNPKEHHGIDNNHTAKDMLRLISDHDRKTLQKLVNFYNYSGRPSPER